MREISTRELEAVIRVQSPWHEAESRFHHAASLLPERQLVEPLWAQIAAVAIGQPFKHKVISGPRRVGKSTLLRHLAKRLVEQKLVPARKIIYLSWDDPALMGQPLKEVLERIVSMANATLQEPVILLADEIAYAEHWDKALKIAYDFPERFPVRIIATSSSAIEVTRGVFESGAGRWSHHFLFPCQIREQARIAGLELEPSSFTGDTLAEMLASIPTGFEPQRSNRELVADFSVSGGFPESAPQLSDTANNIANRDAMVIAHHETISEVLVKVTRVDIPLMFSTRYPAKPAELLYLLAQAPGGLLNLDGIAKDLAITKPTVENILSYLEDAMVVFRLPNYTGSMRKAKKGYFLSNAVPAALSHQTRSTMLAQERGWALENMVAAALFELTKRQHFGTQLFHCRDNGREIDFILQEGHDSPPLAIEVGSSQRHDRTSLNYLLKRHPELAGHTYLVTPDGTADQDSDIKTLPMSEFLFAVEQHKYNLTNSHPTRPKTSL